MVPSSWCQPIDFRRDTESAERGRWPRQKYLTSREARSSGHFEVPAAILACPSARRRVERPERMNHVTKPEGIFAERHLRLRSETRIEDVSVRFGPVITYRDASLCRYTVSGTDREITRDTGSTNNVPAVQLAMAMAGSDLDRIADGGACTIVKGASGKVGHEFPTFRSLPRSRLLVSHPVRRRKNDHFGHTRDNWPFLVTFCHDPQESVLFGYGVGIISMWSRTAYTPIHCPIQRKLSASWHT